MFQVLDWVLGHNEALFRRAQLKALVSIHGMEVKLFGVNIRKALQLSLGKTIILCEEC